MKLRLIGLWGFTATRLNQTKPSPSIVVFWNLSCRHPAFATADGVPARRRSNAPGFNAQSLKARASALSPTLRPISWPASMSKR
jgi:hypothetical protein